MTSVFQSNLTSKLKTKKLYTELKSTPLKHQFRNVLWENLSNSYSLKKGLATKEGSKKFLVGRYLLRFEKHGWIFEICQKINVPSMILARPINLHGLTSQIHVWINKKRKQLIFFEVAVISVFFMWLEKLQVYTRVSFCS